jgi:hypothetical protein
LAGGAVTELLEIAVIGYMIWITVWGLLGRFKS